MPKSDETSHKIVTFGEYFAFYQIQNAEQKQKRIDYKAFNAKLVCFEKNELLSVI